MGDRRGSETVATKSWHFYTGKVVDASAFANCRIFAGTSNVELTEKISERLGLEFNGLEVGAFNDGEVSIKLLDGVRGKDVFIIQSICRHSQNGKKKSVNDALVELLLLISAVRRASARKITAVIPYYAYGRQDRKMTSRVPISAADVARLITTMGVDRVVTIDLHCGQIQGFFPPQVPVDNLTAGPIGAAYIAEQALVNPIVVSPDAGAVPRAVKFRKFLLEKGHAKCGFLIIIKQRVAAGKIESMDLVGDPRNADCIIVDDMVDTAGTLCRAAQVLKDNGARRVIAFCTHGLFSGPAAERIKGSAIDALVVTNTVPLPAALENDPKVKVLSLAPIIAESIKRLHCNQSMSAIFKGYAAKEDAKL